MEDHKDKLIVVLQQAALETAKTKKGFELLHAETHKVLLGKNKRDISLYRPDIVHQALLALMDSPLNKAGKLKVYIHTWNNVLIDINPKCRIPRTYTRFAGLMVQLLHKLQIRAVNSSERLLRVIKNPITTHLPVGCRKIGLSTTGELVNCTEFVKDMCEDSKSPPVVLMIGSHAHGKCEADWVEKYISVSQYSLSAASAASRILTAFEMYWEVL